LKSKAGWQRFTTGSDVISEGAKHSIEDGFAFTYIRAREMVRTEASCSEGASIRTLLLDTLLRVTLRETTFPAANIGCLGDLFDVPRNTHTSHHVFHSQWFIDNKDSVFH
jgi:hypothetical protein